MLACPSLMEEKPWTKMQKEKIASTLIQAHKHIHHLACMPMPMHISLSYTHKSCVVECTDTLAEWNEEKEEQGKKTTHFIGWMNGWVSKHKKPGTNANKYHFCGTTTKRMSSLWTFELHQHAAAAAASSSSSSGSSASDSIRAATTAARQWWSWISSTIYVIA